MRAKKIFFKDFTIFNDKSTFRIPTRDHHSQIIVYPAATYVKNSLGNFFTLPVVTKDRARARQRAYNTE